VLLTSAHVAAAAAPPSGNATGLALLARVHRAYAHVPAVVIFGKTGTLSFRFTLILSSSRTVAEEFVGRQPSNVTTLVGRLGGATYARDPGGSCWRSVPASAPQQFENLGLPFPDQPRMRVGAPTRTAAGSLLPVVADGSPGTFAIDAASARVTEITVTASGRRIAEHVGVVHTTPALPAATPLC